MITKFINKIRDNITSGGIEFIGDGVGDFEQHNNTASVECVIDYLTYLEEQRELAQGWLDNNA